MVAQERYGVNNLASPGVYHTIVMVQRCVRPARGTGPSVDHNLVAHPLTRTASGPPKWAVWAVGMGRVPGRP